MFVLTTNEKLDAILEFCLDNNNGFWSEMQLRKKLFPELNKDEMLVLLRMIDNSNENVLNINFNAFGVLSKSNGLTKGFLDNGGFVRIGQSDLIQLEKQQEKENFEFEKSKVEFKLANSNIEANDLNLKNSKFNKRVNIANIVIGIINILVALGLGYLSYKVGLLEK